MLYAGERTMLRDYFAGARETLILMPKKNGKTTLLAALSLYHLLTTPHARCYVAAASRDQATILYDQAKGFVERSDWLEGDVMVRTGTRELRSRHDTGTIRVLAADADTADGVLPTLALVDELHRQKSSDLYGIFRDGLGARDGRMVTISTAGDDETSPLGLLRASAYESGVVKRDGPYRYVASPDFALHEWALEPNEDRDDLELVAKANPAPWQTERELRRRRASPSMREWQWARFACGVWGLGIQPYFDIERFRELAKPGTRIIPGRAVTLGFDGARRRDATVLVACDIELGHLEVVGAWERPVNAPDDWEVPENEVDERVDYAMARWDVWRLYGDPPFWESALDRWAAKYGKEQVVRWWTNRIKATAFALRAFAGDMVPERMSHDGDELLERHIGNAAKQETRMRDGDEYLAIIRKDGPKSPRKIDGAMAATLAWEARGDAIAEGALKRRNYQRAVF